MKHTSKHQSRGRGLPMALKRVQAPLGVITVESKEGSGSTFRAFLPVAAATNPNPEVRAFEALELAENDTALIVDDDPLLRDIARIVLNHLGFAVLEAQDGLEAIEVFKYYRNNIRFVLCDIIMPRMDGWETLFALRQLAPHLPVILSSGDDRAKVMAVTHCEPPQVFLGKPYGLSELRAAVGQALRSDRQHKITDF